MTGLEGVNGEQKSIAVQCGRTKEQRSAMAHFETALREDLLALRLFLKSK